MRRTPNRLRNAGAQNAEPVAQNAEPDAEGFYSIGGNIPPPAPTTERVPAVRSREADAAGVTGAVILEIRVDESGGVSDARVLQSIPMLDEAAVATVKQWRYAPTLVEGRAVPVKMTVVINFRRCRNKPSMGPASTVSTWTSVRNGLHST